MNLYGLIGYPLTHSFSGTYFNNKFVKEGLVDCKYELFPLPEIEGISELFSSHSFLKGLNVTIPHKINILKYLDSIDKEAASIGSVNCIMITGDGSHLEGFNTDAYGFRESLKPLLRPTHKKALVLGTGGASKAITFVFEQLDIEYLLVSRTPGSKNQLAYSDISEDIIKEFTIIVNTTPLGTYPKTDECPDIPYNKLTPNHLLYDLVYNPGVTKFLAHGRLYGSSIKNGLEMLELQAERSWEIWNRY